MDLNIQYKNHQPHIAAFFIMEFDQDVYEYYYQPPSINLNDKTNGSDGGYKFTADFFVISKDFIGWEVWETDKQLFKKVAVSANLFVKCGKGDYRCPPIEKYARKQGLSFRIRSSKEINTLLEKAKNSFFESSY